MPFGVSTATFLFTKVLREVVKKWRSLGFKIVLFLDDGNRGDMSIEKAKNSSLFVRQDLLDFGFLCSWAPRQTSIDLAIFWDTEEGFLKVTDERIEGFLLMLTNVIDRIMNGNTSIVARKTACLIGQLISVQSAIGSIVRLRSRSLFLVYYKEQVGMPLSQ